MPIVYFDGHCNVCNRFIDFLIRHDHARRLRFAPLQGTTAATHLPPRLVTDLSTMALEEDGAIICTESSAAIKTIAWLGGLFSLMSVFLFVPRIVRDGVYRWVANHRYLFAGRSATCRVPSEAERAQFLP